MLTEGKDQTPQLPLATLGSGEGLARSDGSVTPESNALPRTALSSVSQEKEAQAKSTSYISVVGTHVQNTIAPPQALPRTDEFTTDPSDPHVPTLLDGPECPYWFGPIAEEANAKAKVLFDEGRLTIQCAYPDMRTVACRAISQAGYFADYEIRILYTDQHSSFRISDLIARNGWRLIGQSKPGERDGKNVLLFIDVVDSAALRDLKCYAFRLGNPSWKRDKVFFCFLIHGGTLDVPEVEALGPKRALWKIDALTHLLSSEKELSQEVIDVVRDLTVRLRHRRWVANEEPFLGKVRAAFVQGQLAGVRQFLLEDEEIHAAADAVSPPPRWKNSGPLERATLFVSVYFPKSTIPQFKLLIKTVLENETVEIPRPVVVADAHDGKQIATDRMLKVKSWEQWCADEEQILENAGIQYHQRTEGSFEAGFVEAEMADAVRQSISPGYVLTRFDRLHAAGLLMRPGVPKPVVQGLIELTAEMIVSHPDTYNANWLLDRVAEIDRWRNDAETIAASVSSQQDVEAALRHFLLDVGGQLLNHFYSRLADLCFGLLNNDRTREVTRVFLGKLIAATQPNGMHAVEVIRRLPGGTSSVFDVFPHLRHLCNVGSWETRLAVTRVLLNKMEETPQDCWMVVQRVSEWLPSRNTPKDKPLSGAQGWGLALLYVAFTDYFARFEMQRARSEEPPELWLFSPEGDLSKRITVLAEWLSNPAFCFALKVLLSKEQTGGSIVYESDVPGVTDADFESCRAEMLEGWYSLSGIPVVKRLASESARLLTREEQVSLRVLLRRRGDNLLELIDCASGSERQALLKRRRNAYELSKCCGPPFDSIHD